MSRKNKIAGPYSSMTYNMVIRFERPPRVTFDNKAPLLLGRVKSRHVAEEVLVPSQAVREWQEHGQVSLRWGIQVNQELSTQARVNERPTCTRFNIYPSDSCQYMFIRMDVDRFIRYPPYTGSFMLFQSLSSVWILLENHLGQIS